MPTVIVVHMAASLEDGCGMVLCMTWRSQSVKRVLTAPRASVAALLGLVSDKPGGSLRGSPPKASPEPT